MFQLKRIKFPLKAKKLNELDGVDSTLVQEKDWKIINLFRQNQQQIYNNYQREIVDTDKRMIWYGGLDSGQDIEFRFQRLDGLWYLLEYNNLSN